MYNSNKRSASNNNNNDDNKRSRPDSAGEGSYSAAPPTPYGRAPTPITSSDHASTQSENNDQSSLFKAIATSAEYLPKYKLVYEKLWSLLISRRADIVPDSWIIRTGNLCNKSGDKEEPRVPTFQFIILSAMPSEDEEKVYVPSFIVQIEGTNERYLEFSLKLVRLEELKPDNRKRYTSIPNSSDALSRDKSAWTCQRSHGQGIKASLAEFIGNENFILKEKKGKFRTIQIRTSGIDALRRSCSTSDQADILLHGFPVNHFIISMQNDVLTKTFTHSSVAALNEQSSSSSSSSSTTQSSDDDAFNRLASILLDGSPLPQEANNAASSSTLTNSTTQSALPIPPPSQPPVFTGKPPALASTAMSAPPMPSYPLVRKAPAMSSMVSSAANAPTFFAAPSQPPVFTGKPPALASTAMSAPPMPSYPLVGKAPAMSSMVSSAANAPTFFAAPSQPPVFTGKPPALASTAMSAPPMPPPPLAGKAPAVSSMVSSLNSAELAREQLIVMRQMQEALQDMSQSLKAIVPQQPAYKPN